MTPDRLAKARRIVRDLSRPDLVQLSKLLGVDRFALTDLADIGAKLPAEAMAGLDAWLCRAELRAMILDSRNGPRNAAMADETGISDAHRDAFAGGDDDALTAEQQAIAFDYLIGASKPVGPATVFASAMPAPINPARSAALAIINAMKPEQLVAFVAEHAPAKAA